MKNEIREYRYENGEIQRVQAVTCDRWEDLEFLRPGITRESLEHVASIFRDFFVKAAPALFGTLRIFHIPEGTELPFEAEGDRHAAARRYLRKKGRSPEGKAFLERLEREGWLYTVKGKNPFYTLYMPFGDMGFLSGAEARFKVNASFFMFSFLDPGSPYDAYGTPLGLCVKDGKVLNPPLYGREALIVKKDGGVCVRPFGLEELDTGIPGKVWQRPQARRTPRSSLNDVVVVGDRVTAVKRGGGTKIPVSGFVISTEREDVSPGDRIAYRGAEDILFAVQCGNSIVVDGKKTPGFTVPFYDVRKPGMVKTAPSSYPLDYEKDRAPRIAAGADRDGRPVFVWAEGKGKNGYEPGKDSCGASLSEMCDILEDLGIPNAVSLDGGGSAQIEYEGKRYLKISDRDFATGEESERPIPMGIVVR